MKVPYKINRHSIKIAAKKEDIFKEIVLWGEADWWPRFSNMKFINESGSEVKEGTRYLMKIVPFGPSWRAQVTRLEPNYSIRRDFLDGMLDGFETVSILNTDKEYFEIVYEMFYQINSKINRFLWPLILERIHNSNIREILKNLKEYAEKT